MSRKGPDPGRRSLWKIFTDKEEMGEIGRALGRFVREVRDETSPSTQAQISRMQEEVEADINAVEADVKQLGIQIEALQAADATQTELLHGNRDLLMEIMDRISTLEERIAQGEEQARGEEEKGRWHIAADRLAQIKNIFIGATAAALYELLLGDTVWPWLKQQWFTLVAPDGVEPPPSPLPEPKTAGVEFPQNRKLSRLKIDWVTVPGGYFWMGSDPRFDRAAYDDGQPQHRLYLPTYQIARVPITNAQYKLFVDATGHDSLPHYWDGVQIPTGKENHPVVDITWDNAFAFTKWAGGRLPTEAEWEKAARGSDGRIYPWGNSPPTARHGNFNQNVQGTTMVGSYKAGQSPYGCLDMAGNVWEWCSSEYKPYPYNAGDGREELEGRRLRVLRGGSWYSNPEHVRCAYRRGDLPNFRLGYHGFRIARGSLMHPDP
ncbi:MAG: SUMF1/EgtB/PvdO family nonheme iron enzyme [Caldilineaceae bacterium]|nr:SUMF1/EgtB/PvdO family nonheme iron enzyme [Caldilineaceae bacterium]